MKVIYQTPILEKILDAKMDAEMKCKKIDCIKLTDKEISELWNLSRCSENPTITIGLRNRFYNTKNFDEFTAAVAIGDVRIFGVTLGDEG